MADKKTLDIHPATLTLVVFFMGLLQLMAYSVEEANKTLFIYLMGTVIVGIIGSGILLNFKRWEKMSDALRSFLISVPVAVFLQLINQFPFIEITQKTAFEFGIAAGVILFVLVTLGMVAFKIKR
jgi:hypothetical protein